MISRADAILLLLEELDQAIEKHPVWPSDPVHAAAIMVEEAGEALQAALDLTYGGKHAHKLKKEIVHTGAMAIRNLINLR